MSVPPRDGLDALALADPAGGPVIMGILNVTPDSFSDGGRFLARDAALAQARAMVEEGAAIIDVGGESSRPGALDVPEVEQVRRVVPVLQALRAQLPDHVVLSIDTRSPQVAAAALDAGASLVNDISGGASSGMLELVARRGAGIVLMHMQGTPQTMQLAPVYADVVAEVRAHLAARARTALEASVPSARILLDPGIGFGKTRAHNLALLQALQSFVALGHPLLLGASRKRFMGAICGETVFEELLGATCATTALGVAAGVRVFRVHDVRANRQAAEVAWAIARR
jgi:dihydropteroate synthase